MNSDVPAWDFLIRFHSYSPRAFSCGSALICPLERLDVELLYLEERLAIGMTEPVIPFINMLECVQKVHAVLVVFENGLLFIAA
jgi:hypothetical protein